MVVVAVSLLALGLAGCFGGGASEGTSGEESGGGDLADGGSSDDGSVGGVDEIDPITCVLGEGILSASPISSAPYECRTGPELIISMETGSGRVPITLEPAL